MVAVSGNLQVDVKGEEIFLVDKKLVSSFAGHFRKLIAKSTRNLGNLKLVIFHDFPGGAECFELIARFCYNHGRIKITHSNVFSLHCAATFLEMPELMNQTEAYMETIHLWTWSELLVGLRQSQDLLTSMNSLHIRELLSCLVGKITMSDIYSPSSSSSDSSRFQFSGEMSTRNSRNSRNSNFPTAWWFEYLVFLNIDLFERLISTMLSQKFDQTALSSFLFYYQKSRYSSASQADKCKLTETLINLLSLLDESYVPYRNLLSTFGVTSSMKLSKYCKSKLENLIGSRLDEATIDYLLVRSPVEKKYAYDVNLIIRLLKIFCGGLSKQFSLGRVKNVVGLIDSYLIEVAPDPYLKSSKFVALVAAMPEFARESNDTIFRARDMYFEVHSDLSEDEKKRICSAVKNQTENAKVQPKMLFAEADKRKSLSEIPLRRTKNVDFPTENIHIKQRLSLSSSGRSFMKFH